MAVGIGIVSILIWKVSPLVTAYAHQAEGYKYLNQALELLGDQTGPDYCVNGGISDPRALGLVERAVGSLQKAQKSMPTHSQALLILGRAYCLSGNFEAAVKAYEGYTALRPKNPLGHLELGFAYEEAGLEEAAVEKWEMAGGTGQEFLDAGDEALAGDDFYQAFIWYERVITLNPGWSEPWQKTGLIYQELGDWDKAVQAFQVAWELNHEMNATSLATALSQQGDFQAEEKVLNQSLATFPNSLERLIWWKSLGENLSKQEKHTEAANVYGEAILEYPNDPTLHISLGWVYYQMGEEIEIVLEEFKLAILLDEQAGDSYFAAAQLFVKEKLYAEADLWFQTAIQNEPGNRGWYIARGNAAREGANLTLAIQVYGELLQFDPNYDPTYYEIAWAYHLLGQSDKAIESMEKAIMLSATPKAWYYVRLGLIYEKNNVYDEASKAYYQALKLDPVNTVAKQGIERLSSNNTP